MSESGFEADRKSFRQRPDRGNLTAELRDEEGYRLFAEVVDISTGGAHLRYAKNRDAIPPGTSLIVTLTRGEGRGRSAAETVMLHGSVVERELPAGELAVEWQLDLSRALDRATDRTLSSWISAWQREDLRAGMPSLRKTRDDRA